MKSRLFLVALIAAFFCTCKEKNQPTSTQSDQSTSRGVTISCDPTSKTVALAGDEFTVTVKSTAAWSASTDQSWISISPNSGQGDAFVNITVAAGKAGSAKVLFSNGESTATLVINREESVTPPDPTPKPSGDGVLSGEFSVSATTKVHFSQGNLQYVGTWQFAEHQWEYFGKNQSDNHRDLFGWGTGDEPNKVSSKSSDYSTFVDWGTNAITNGGNTANQWRTLTIDEWVYLFNTRTDAGSKYGAAKVNGITGVVLLPDDWTLPSGCGFTAGMTNASSSDDWSLVASTNKYDANQWSLMESAGAVFLPAAGNRVGTDVYLVGSGGDYWSATPCGPNSAYFLYFYSYYLNRQDLTARTSGRSVRLVR